jgi:TonB family protein
MGPRVRVVGLGLAVVLAGAALLPVSGTAQEATSSSVSKRKVRSSVVPVYPALAREMNVMGKVRIEATISADGRVTGTKVLGGSPLLVNASLDAIQKWRFEPEPKETTETFEFNFDKPE